MSGGMWRSAVCALLLLTSAACGAPADPQLGQEYGGVDQPCAIGGAVSKAVQHCTAHVVLANNGGEGTGYVTLQVPLKNAQGAAPASSATCGRALPDMPSGASVDLVCDFDLAPGQTVAAAPSVKSVVYLVAVTHGTSGFDFKGAAVLVLALAVALLAIAMVVAGPGRPSGEAAARSRARSESPDVEYDLPSLPR